MRRIPVFEGSSQPWALAESRLVEAAKLTGMQPLRTLLPQQPDRLQAH